MVALTIALAVVTGHAFPHLRPTGQRAREGLSRAAYGTR